MFTNFKWQRKLQHLDNNIYINAVPYNGLLIIQLPDIPR